MRNKRNSDKDGKNIISRNDTSKPQQKKHSHHLPAGERVGLCPPAARGLVG